MIPQIKCMNHNDEEIFLLDISKEPIRKNRCYCIECMNEVKLTKTLSIRKITEQATLFFNSLSDDIKDEYDTSIQRINQAIKSLNTIKKQTLSSFDKMIKKCEDQQIDLIRKMNKDIESYQNLIKDITMSKLQQLGEMLSGNYSYDLLFKLSLQSLQTQIMTDLNQISYDESILELEQILTDGLTLQSQITQDDVCKAIACNQLHNIVAGGKGFDIVIWQQNKYQLIETNILKGHTDYVTAIQIQQEGDIIVSGGSSNDKSIRLWKKKSSEWECKQIINDHQNRITDLKLTEDQLISASDDKLIKIWQLNLQECKLECVQTLDDQNNWIYWIDVSKDSTFLVSSCFENSFIIYKNQQTQLNPWKKQRQIETQGIINRVCFTNYVDLLVQQVNPPKLMVFQKNQNNDFQVNYEVILNQQDSENILFPVLQIGNAIYLKNQKFIYIIKRLRIGHYYVRNVMNGFFKTGCLDSSGEGIILWNEDNQQIEIYK